MISRKVQNFIHSELFAGGLRSSANIRGRILGLLQISLIIEILVILGLGLGDGRT